VTFDRFIARLATASGDDWRLKGGYAMELRIDGARTTKDVDLSIRMFGSPSAQRELAIAIRERLEAVARVDLHDYFEFTVGAAEEEVKEAVYGGVRFPVAAFVDGRLFQPFRVDVVVGDPPPGEADELVGQDWLGFAGIPPARMLAVRAEQQFAEKLHAYTFPRTGSPNSRVKDLVDMVLLIGRTSLDEAALLESIRSTFSRRASHPVPSKFPPPPSDWSTQFATYARECGLSENVDEAYKKVSAFLTAILSSPS
jgi:hypothetical protein